ncbi:uncharacterized protein LOC110266808 [Arachis ipaensis]|uniref:uncharacterized protein LOC110266808 n=1 Tax=Arachis ipaensis TaxID=130454 RepID=UPI000A2B0740|nr:uncharacterized protein LOC110266808 [Arachis ipaensis]XP_025678342.1 uncharacterized protein LOC112778208 [Arachis hypogaea]
MVLVKGNHAGGSGKKRGKGRWKREGGRESVRRRCSSLLAVTLRCSRPRRWICPPNLVVAPLPRSTLTLADPRGQTSCTARRFCSSSSVGRRLSSLIMYRSLSSILYVHGSSLFSLFTPKPSRSLISAFFSRSLQNHIDAGHNPPR